MNPVGKESNSRLVSGGTAPSPATEPKFGVPREAPVMGYTARTRCFQDISWPEHAVDSLNTQPVAGTQSKQV